MKAAVIDRFGGPEEIYYTDIEKPVPGPDEVLVKNVYIGVGKPDYIMRSGICPFLEAKPPKLVVGNECAGIVEAVGSDVKGIEPGMQVCVNSGLGYGAYAEYIAVPQKFVTVFPDEFPLKYAPGFLNYMVAYALLNEIGRGTDGKSIYIYGAAGGVDTAVIQTALLQGIEVIASASSQEKCDYIKSLGAQCVFNHKEQDAKEVIMDITGWMAVQNWISSIQLSNSPVMHRPFVHSLSIYMMISRNVWQRFGRSVWIGLFPGKLYRIFIWICRCQRPERHMS